MKNSIGKPYEGIENHEHLIEDNNTRIKLHVWFDEGGADSLLIIITFRKNNESKLSSSELHKH